MKVTVNRQQCCGSGNCVSTAPAVFDQDASDGRVLVLLDEPPEYLHGAVRDAEALCPTGTIRID